MRTQQELNELEICTEYQKGRDGVEALCKKYHVGKLRIKEILKKHHIEIKKRGKQQLNENFVVSDWKIEKFPIMQGSYYVAVDKKSGFITRDYMNSAGVLTTHIKKCYGIEAPTLYDRRKYYMRTGNYWWEQWFDIQVKADKPTKKCPYCAWETVDIDNRSGAFEQHILKAHNIDKLTYLNAHPEDRGYFLCVDKLKNRQMETDNDKFVMCQICGRKLARVDNHHLKIHNITKLEYVKKYGNAKLSSKEYHNKQSKASSATNVNISITKNSKSELEIKDFIKSGGLECGANRKILCGKEIDIFVPSKNVGIEYNGLLWHSEWFGHKNKNYHIAKLNECRKSGVKLISIFEDEYELHKDIVLSKIGHLLNIKNDTLTRIYARNCFITEIYAYEAKDFLNKFHIQGFAKSTVYIGAFHNGELVGVMSFSEQKNNNWELTRFASDINYICCGIGGKLFKYFTRNYTCNEIKSFADRRWTIDETNNIYIKLGFEFKEFVRPTYTYYNSKLDRFKRFHKFNFRKSKLLKRHPELDPRLTETEMAKQLGYDRIWDCGLIKYVYTNNRH